MRYASIAKLSGIPSRYQYPLFEKKNQNIIDAAKKFIKKNFNEDIESNPILNIDKKKLIEIKKNLILIRNIVIYF